MNNYVYSRYDLMEHVFSPVFVAASDELAVRSYIYLFSDFPAYSDYKTPYQLWRIGVFNNETGLIEGTDPVVLDTVVGDFVKNYTSSNAYRLEDTVDSNDSCQEALNES